MWIKSTLQRSHRQPRRGGVVVPLEEKDSVRILPELHHILVLCIRASRLVNSSIRTATIMGAKAPSRKAARIVESIRLAKHMNAVIYSEYNAEAGKAIVLRIFKWS